MAKMRANTLVAAGAGVAAAALGAGIGELTAALVAPESSPFAAIGGALIDAAPSWAKDTAIALFGTADKIALLVGIGIVLLAVAGVAGVLDFRRPPWGRIVLVIVGTIGAAAAVSRAQASPWAWLPSLVAGAASAGALLLILRPLRTSAGVVRERKANAGPRTPGAAPATVAAHTPGATARTPGATVGTPLVEPIASNAPADPNHAPDPDRRRVLIWAAVATAAGAAAALGGNIVRSGARAVTVIRDAIVLPAAVTPAAPVPAGADLNLDGLASVITRNEDFYRIDTALVVPQIDPAEWSLRIHGLVEQEVVITWDELLALPLEESTTTLACVSNEVGGTLIGNALWLGYPIRELLARARPAANADMVLSRSIDGFTASTPIEALTDDRNAIFAVGMNGTPLPAEHGFPVRMVVPGLYGYVSATKWVTELEVTRFDSARAYWTDRGWSELGPVKLQSRIDVPRTGQSIAAGDAVIAGVAWQQHIGIAGVEVQIDDGPWMPADLAPAISADTWVQWSLPWVAEAGRHRVRSRAISVTGEVQTSDEQGVVPDGATGWHTRQIDVS